MNKNSNNQAENLAKPVLTTVFLSNYFPYGLKAKNENRSCKIITINGFYYSNSEIMLNSIELNGGISSKEIKLILKPLSDLIDNILEDGNDENYELHLQLSELLNTNDCKHFVKALVDNKYYAVDVRLWNDIEEWLNKNHFDWKFNLIEKGLAISIHDVE